MLKLRLMLLMLLASPIASQITLAAATPPEPSLRKPPSTWVGYVLMFIFFGIVISVSIMSAKRGHQD